MHGAEGLLDRLPGAKGPHPNRVAPLIEMAIPAHALNHPNQGAQGVADELMLRGLHVGSGVVDPQRPQDPPPRLLWLEEAVCKCRFKLNEKQIRALKRFRPPSQGRRQHLHKIVLDCFSRHVWPWLYASKMPVTGRADLEKPRAALLLGARR